MPTGDSFVNLVLKRFLSQSRMSGNFLNYLQDMFYDGISRIFPNHGLFTYPSGLVNNGDGTFTIGTDPLIGTDGDGHILKLTGADRNTNIPFEDTAATYYWIGMHYIEVPSGVYINPRTGQVEYDLILEEIGELGNPTSASDAGGGTIKLVVDSILENGVDYSGREVRVWLTNPMSADAAVAFETLTVSYDGGSGENSVTTTTLLGQASVSVATADYQVAALGVTVKKSATNPWTAGSYCILGYLEGATTNETLIDSNDLSGGGGHTFQSAYDGAGAGAGRNATIANEAIELDQLNLTLAEQDVFHAPLRLIKDGERSVMGAATPPLDSKDTEGGIDLLQRMAASYGYMNRVNLLDQSGTDNLRGSEAIDATSGTTISFTRSGVDLTSLGSGSITSELDRVEIVNSSNGNDGIYRITSIGATTLSLAKFNGSNPLLTTETGTSMEARIYRPILQSNALSWAFGNRRASLQLSNYEGFAYDMTSGGSQVPLHIIGADDSFASTPMINVTDQWDTEIFAVRYSGRVNMYGILYMNNNDIDTQGGDILSGTGLIDSEGGDVLSGGGIIDSEGGIIRSGGGVINSEGGDIQANGGDITTTSFGIISSNHNVIADNDGNGIGDFKYGAARSVWRSLNIEHGMDLAGGGWGYTTAAVNGQGFWEKGGSSYEIYFPFMLPKGANLTRVQVLVTKINTSLMTLRIWRNDIDWSTPAVTPTQIASPTTTTSSGFFVLQSPSFSHTSLSDEDRYYIAVDADGTVADKIWAVRLQISMDTFVPTISS